MPNSLPKLPALRAELKKLDRLGDVRVSFRDGELLVTSDFMICDKLEAALAAYGYEWVGPRYKANGKIQPEVEGGRHNWTYRYEYFAPAAEPEPEPTEPEPAGDAALHDLALNGANDKIRNDARAELQRRAEVEAAECTHCDGTGIDDTLRGDGESCWYCFGTGQAENVRRYRSQVSYGYPAFTSKAKTSADAPLKLDEVPLGLPGKLFVGFAPGKVQGNRWNRDMDADLDVLRDAEVTHVLCLVEDFELKMLKMADYAQKCADRGILLHRLPIKDGGVGKLDAVFTTALSMLWMLEKGESVYVHCKGGLGRAGTLAACILLLENELHDDKQAIAAVRAARSPRAIENKRQEQFIADFYATYGENH